MRALLADLRQSAPLGRGRRPARARARPDVRATGTLPDLRARRTGRIMAAGGKVTARCKKTSSWSRGVHGSNRQGRKLGVP